MRDFSSPEQLAIRCAIVRGGTSKGLFFLEHDLPRPGALRDRLLKRIMGTPDVVQIDGLGGSRLITSKIAIVKRSARPDADVDYTFGQVDIDRDAINWDANCGNISSGVGPFAINAGLVTAVSPTTVVRIYNVNTEKILIAHVPVEFGRAKVGGDFAIDGVPGSGAEIFMDYHLTVGAKTGRMLPTGRVRDRLDLGEAGMVEATICDVANPLVFLRARDIGLTGGELPEAIDGNAAVQTALRRARGNGAVLSGLCAEWTQAEAVSPLVPSVVVAAPPADYVSLRGELVPAATMDLRARFIFLSRCHESMAGTGSMCTAAASRVEGSIVHEALGAPPEERDTLRIGHPLGIMSVRVKGRTSTSDGRLVLETLGFSRTARHIMDGVVYVPTADLG